MAGNAPDIEDDTSMLFSYFTEDPVKEFTVRVETWVEESTIAVNGVVLGNGDQQKFSWDFGSKTWSPISGGIDKNTTKFMASKTNPTSTGYNQACKKEIVNAYEGVKILLTHGDGNPQTMEEIYDYVFSAKRILNSWPPYCEDYRPYYGPVENEPMYGIPYDLDTELEEYYRLAAWRVAYLITDNETIAGIPKDPINFTAHRLGSLTTKNTIKESRCDCAYTEVEKTWTGNSEDIKYNPYPNFSSYTYLIAAIMGRDVYGYPCSVTPDECRRIVAAGNHQCGGGLICYHDWYPIIGEVFLPQMGIMTDSDGHNPVFGDSYIKLNYQSQFSICAVYDEEGELVEIVCEADLGPNAEAVKYEFRAIEFRAIPTPEHRI
jgi:hypothetical protein